jgi:ADP-dependent phosphofructokinase/glucokinase
MKKSNENYFAKRENVKNIENALNTLSRKKMLTVNGGLEQLEESFEDDSDYKNYAESTSYNRITAYAKIRRPR